MQCTTYDRKEMEPIALTHARAAGVGGSVAVATCDFFKEALPGADVVAMGMILHDWGLPKKKLLMKKVAGHVALAV